MIRSVINSPARITCPLGLSESFGPSTGSFNNSAFTVEVDNSGRKPFSDEHIILNVGGFRYKTTSKTLNRFPDSLLADQNRRREYYEPNNNEYFFDRNHLAFDAVLECFRSGRIVRPSITVSIPIFVRELLFYEIGETLVEDFLKSEELYDDPIIYPKNPIQKYIHQLLTVPDSSIPARIIALIDIAIVIVAIIGMCIVTLPSFNIQTTNVNGTIVILSGVFAQNSFSNPFFIIEIVCNIWFILDLTLRFIVSPDKKHFFWDFLNVVDFISIVPFVVDVIISAMTNDESEAASVIYFLLAFRILRIFRVFKILKLNQYSDGLMVLTKTVKAARRELGIMVLLLTTGMIFFGAAIYFAERGNPNTDYTSIPASFWWSVITWTTIGYGDVFPKTPSGKVVGCVCAVTGVLALGLIIPPVVRRFEHYFYRAQIMMDLEVIYSDHQAEMKLRTSPVQDVKNSLYAMI